ncbi:MAG: hypothetical protein ACR2Q3_05805 [Woeseiaceae bacterium]
MRLSRETIRPANGEELVAASALYAHRPGIVYFGIVVEHETVFMTPTGRFVLLLPRAIDYYFG